MTTEVSHNRTPRSEIGQVKCPLSVPIGRKGPPQGSRKIIVNRFVGTVREIDHKLWSKEGTTDFTETRIKTIHEIRVIRGS